MREASQAFKSNEGINLLKVLITWPNNEHAPLELSYDNLSAFSYSANGTESNSIGLGFASICTATMSLINTSGKWDNIKFKGANAIIWGGKRLPLGDEFVKLGHFIIESGVKNEGAIQITAEDNMALLDVRFKGIAFPCTIKDLITKACEQVGLALKTQTFTNFGKIVDTLENVTQFTCREIVSLACELCGGFAIANSDGEIEVKWFNTVSTSASIENQFILSCKPDEAKTPAGISAYFSGEEFFAGANESILYLTEDNFLVRNLTASDKEDLLLSIFNERIATMKYDTGSIEARGSFLIEPGDVIQFEHKDKTYKFIVSSIKLSGNLKMTITSAGLSSSSSTSGGSSSISGGRGESSSLQIAHMLSYEDTALSPRPGFLSAVELISVFITQAGNHVPIAMFTTTFRYLSQVEHVAKVKISLLVGSFTVHSFDQNCHPGSNTISFSWPLNDLPQGASKISITASVINETSSSQSFEWKQGDTSLAVLGKGFATVSTWNGLIMLSDTFKPIPVMMQMNKPYDLTRLIGEVHSNIMGYKDEPIHDTFRHISIDNHTNHKDTILIAGFSDRISVVKEGQ